MIRTQYGYSPQKGYMQRELDAISELKADIMPDYDIHEYTPLLDSSNMSQQEWIKISKDIENSYHKYDGFVVLHGTDTMAYTASALAFMLEGLSKPVIITGSQIPLCEARNDARENIITALQIAAGFDIPEVCLYFGGKLMRGCRSVKSSSDALDAFESPNFSALAKVGVDIEMNYNLIIHTPFKELNVVEFGNYPIVAVKIFPGMQTNVFKNILESPLKGIVIEAFGLGNIPTKDNELTQILKDASNRGIVIVICTQCLKGSTNIGNYEASSGLVEIGAVSGYDITVEAAVTKLYYLFSKGLTNEEVKKYMTENIRGELSKAFTILQ